jgi:hypothetical protein
MPSLCTPSNCSAPASRPACVEFGAIRHNPNYERISPMCPNYFNYFRFLTITLLFFYITIGQLDVSYAMTIDISKADGLVIAQRVFKNECSVEKNCLLEWNAGEDFLSLGLEHFIWFPEESSGIFKDSFRSYLKYAQKEGRHLPVSLDKHPFPPCLWSSRKEFLNSKQTQEYQEIENFIRNTKDCQADYLIETTRRSLKKIINAVPEKQRARITKYLSVLTSQPQGLYAVIDYINFKGSGTGPNERYQGEGWGLLQVLQEMSDMPNAKETLEEFVRSAKIVLTHRVFNAPKGRHEEKWLKGWLHRVDTYLEHA